MISVVNKSVLKNVFGNIHYLISLAEKNINILVVTQMKVIVSEHKSENSSYEKLDTIEKPELISISSFGEDHTQTGALKDFSTNHLQIIHNFSICPSSLCHSLFRT